MNLLQQTHIGQGATFPIKLTTPVDKDGNPQMTTIMVDGEPHQVPKVGWYVETGSELVRNNLTALFTYHIGERFRQENFGTRLWECIEEPNTDTLSFLAANFIKEALSYWEERIMNLSVETLREGSKLYIKIRFQLVTGIVSDTIVEYDNSTHTTYVY